MWIGGYSDWTPAEQREWDRDLEENERRYDEKRASETPTTENISDSHWMELALDDPMFEVEYFRAAGTHLYSFDFIKREPKKAGPRNIDFELVYALYLATSEIIEAIKPAKSSRIKVLTSSREHFGVDYTADFPVDQWSYTQVDNIMEGLAEQLTMRQNLNRGLLVRFIFIE